jgi:lipopolysaccharide export LptBFGC system permease protein LptF
LQFGMQRFHRAMSVTLLILASLILVVEFFRDDAIYPRLVLAGVLTVFFMVALRLSKRLFSRHERA